ncbi:MAG: Holliday junction resolvase RuvX [Candidatus Omnitrophica bacterium CG22_combo_CG10-13_8_21_14_all_43_16]|nr:MAG: Holliday junction resolvase RuvX [Candidatus Omnitrophica bacterium CG22_combo_CG10-13_8_21_14_all_43_16]
MERILALDFGEKRIGVAVSDSLNIIAQSVGTIERKGIKNDLKKIAELVKEYEAGKMIVGLPLNMDGTEGKSASRAINFVNDLRKEIQIEVEMLDERLTTAQGERVFLEADMSRKKRKQNLDKIAAQLILQNYLDSHVQKNRIQ